MGERVAEKDAPVERKVIAGAIGAGAGVIVSDFINWGLDTLLWNGSEPPEVPAPVAGFVGLVVTTALAFLGGWSARHTFRTDPDALQAAQEDGLNND